MEMNEVNHSCNQFQLDWLGLLLPWFKLLFAAMNSLYCGFLFGLL